MQAITDNGRSSSAVLVDRRQTTQRDRTVEKGNIDSPRSSAAVRTGRDPKEVEFPWRFHRKDDQFSGGRNDRFDTIFR